MASEDINATAITIAGRGRSARLVEVTEIAHALVPNVDDRLKLLIAIIEYGHAAASEAADEMRKAMREAYAAKS